ncbi:MAG: AraC family transcriptional regulator of adaptative response [Pseudohongiellaceae bacterium]|jgi:AraC family transcriptional regulator of adaptative response/methylated-DNA-[protein]-cysteine methyltransferase
MTSIELPPRSEMLADFLAGEATYDGVFFIAVRTTGIFCRPSCSARKPLPKNVDFYPTSRDATFAGYRPCKRCHPLQLPGAAPEWLAQLLAQVDGEPTRRWKDADLRAAG